MKVPPTSVAPPPRCSSQALPDVFDRFGEAAARVTKKDLDAAADHREPARPDTRLHRTSTWFATRAASRSSTRRTASLAEVLSRIENRTSYGETASGRYLADEFAKEPFGWEFDVVRLLVVALLRAGKIEATSKGQVIESALSLEARTTFTNNNLFRQSSFRPRTTDCEFTDYIDAAEAYRTCFGKELQELEENVIANAIRETTEGFEEGMRDVSQRLATHGLPGTEILQAALNNIVGFRRQRDCQALKAFTGCHQELKEAIKRTAELDSALTETALFDLGRARTALDQTWPFLEGEPDITDADREHANALADLIARETFFRELPAIDQHTKALETAYAARLQGRRRGAYPGLRGGTGATPRRPPAGSRSTTTSATASPNPSPTYAAHPAKPPSIPSCGRMSDACSVRRDKAVEELLRLLDGNRVVKVSASSYFAGGVENEEQLDQALGGLKEQCLELIGAGKKVLDSVRP